MSTATPSRRKPRSRSAPCSKAPAARYVDGGIIGLPPPPGHTGTRIYVSGPAAREVSKLSDFGVPFPFLDGPIGAASALKMSYAGITKGFTAVAVTMVLGATRGGSAAALHKELEMSQPQLLGWLTRQVPRMPPKAYRWVAEMEEIGHFVGDGTPGGDMYAAIAKLYEDIAAALRAPQTADNPVAQLAEFFEPPDGRDEGAQAGVSQIQRNVIPGRAQRTRNPDGRSARHKIGSPGRGRAMRVANGGVAPNDDAKRASRS